MVKWGHEEDKKYLKTDWTKDPEVWDRFLNELLAIPKLKNIHFMGGETLLTKRFEQFVDFLIEHKRFDLSLSFVTNGTTFNEDLIVKLKQFNRIGIEVSIETTTAHNSYVRQGTDTKLVLANIKRYQEHADRITMSVTLRTAISALTIGYYPTLLELCLEEKLLIKSLLVTGPTCMDVGVLPKEVKDQYKEKYHAILDKIAEVDISQDYNESDPNNYTRSVKMQAEQALKLLDQPEKVGLSDLVAMCRRWDDVFGFNAIELYPELAQVFKEYGY